MKIKNLTWLVTIILLLAIGLYIVFSKNKNANLGEVMVEEKAFDCDSLNYSRLSLFNTSDDRVSLNIPELWEGDYRLKEEGSRAMFYYLLQDGVASKIFSIDKQNNLNEGDEMICAAGDFKIVLNLYVEEAELYYDKIINGLGCIKKSIKCY